MAIQIPKRRRRRPWLSVKFVGWSMLVFRKYFSISKRRSQSHFTVWNFSSVGSFWTQRTPWNQAWRRLPFRKRWWSARSLTEHQEGSVPHLSSLRRNTLSKAPLIYLKLLRALYVHSYRRSPALAEALGHLVCTSNTNENERFCLNKVQGMVSKTQADGKEMKKQKRNTEKHI